MKRTIHQWQPLFGLIIILLGSSCTSASDPFQSQRGPSEPPEGAFSVLFVGNSLTYTNDLPGVVEKMLETAGIGPVAVSSRAFPNYGLQDHWVTQSTMSALAGGWDVVIMQQGPSATEGRPSLISYSKLFAAEIRNAGGTPGLYMVWPARVRDFDFNGVSDSYATAANEVDGYLFPAGEAWLKAWDKGVTLPLYGPDGFHPSPVGTYLAALVIYEQLSGKSLTELPLDTPGKLGLFEANANDVAKLHDAAAEANEDFAREDKEEEEEE